MPKANTNVSENMNGIEQNKIELTAQSASNEIDLMEVVSKFRKKIEPLKDYQPFLYLRLEELLTYVEECYGGGLKDTAWKIYKRAKTDYVKFSGINNNKRRVRYTYNKGYNKY